MNQDNNFNSQGNNGISSNQQVNNQNFNPSMELNQQSFNTQSIHSFQQPIMQESTPNSMDNTFESGNSNNQNFNSKTTKKNSLILIVGVVVTFVVVGIGIVFGSKLFFDDDKNLNDSKLDFNNNIKNGSAKLVATSTERIERINNINAYNYFETKDENGNNIIVDINGNELFAGCNYTYIGDSYFLLDNNYGKLDDKEYDDSKSGYYVYDTKIKEHIFKFNCFLCFDNINYKDGVIYYSNSDYDYSKKQFLYFTTAYDLVNKKEVFKTDGKIELVYNGVTHMINEEKGPYKKNGIVGDYLYLKNGNYDSKIRNSYYASKIVDLNGNVIISGNTDKCEMYIMCMDDVIHTYALYNGHYLKVKFNDYIEVYDFNNKEVSTISLKPNDTTTYSLDGIFYNGLFSVMECDKNSNYCKHVLYDNKKNIVLESDDYLNYAYYFSEHSSALILAPDILLLNTMNKYYLIKDNVIIDKFDHYVAEYFTDYLEGNENIYILVENKNSGDSKTTKKFINLKTLEKFDVPLENMSENFDESLNGEYIILNNESGYYVYDSKFNLKYQSTNPLDPINDKYVFEYELKGDDKMYIVNIETGKKNELDTKGKFMYELSAGGFVTSDGTNYYLYAFN